MNAYLMSAGLATRLRPVTESVPKCLLKVEGVEMLEHWLNACLNAGCFDEIFVNVHHCSDQMNKWIDKFKKKSVRKFGEAAIKSIKIIDETSRLLGTAGTLYWHGDTSSDFFLAYTDTFSRQVFQDLPFIIRKWQANPDNAVVGLVTFNLPKDASAGAIDVDFMSRVKSFSEKGSAGMVGWAGMMMARNTFYEEITIDDRDLAKDVFPRLKEKMIVIDHVQAYDIGRGIKEYDEFNSKVRPS